MLNGNLPTAVKQVRLIMLPFVVFIMQFLTPLFSGILIAVLILLAVLKSELREECILPIVMICGYQVWLYASGGIGAAALAAKLNPAWAVIASRFALLGYLCLFALWHMLDKTCTDNFGVGDFGAEIRFPFVWSGGRDSVLRFTAVFSMLCMLFAGIFIFLKARSLIFVFSAIVFAFVNSILEEFLWRGYILNRTCDIYGEKAGLIVMSLAFGLYHYSLGFTIPICLLFSLGGIYFGGAALRARGLLSPIIMHGSMNVLFVSIGIIF